MKPIEIVATIFLFAILVSSSEALSLNGQVFLSSVERGPIRPPGLIVVNQNSFQAASPLTLLSPQALGMALGTVQHPEVRNDIIQYMVREGDSLWSIANEFNISVDTIVWANDLRRTIIRPGQELVILPVSGVKHIVKEGDTISEIAERYGDVGTETILDFNNLLREDSLFIGQLIIVPNGRERATISVVRTTNTNTVTVGLTPEQVRANFSTNNYWGQSWAFPFGQCTWWVAQKRPIGRWGHAKSWLSNAQRDGFRICRGSDCQPQVGAVLVIRGNPVFGHVVYVEEVSGDKIVFSEMNNIGWGRINERTVRIGDSAIIGYIY